MSVRTRTISRQEIPLTNRPRRGYGGSRGGPSLARTVFPFFLWLVVPLGGWWVGWLRVLAWSGWLASGPWAWGLGLVPVRSAGVEVSARFTPGVSFFYTLTGHGSGFRLAWVRRSASDAGLVTWGSVARGLHPF